MGVKAMNCDKYREVLHEFAAGSLNELDSKAIEKHLKICESCRREVYEIREIRRLLKSSSECIAFPPIDLKSNIMSSVNLGKYNSIYKATLGELTNWGMSLVAAGFILLFMNLAPMSNVTAANISEKVMNPMAAINKSVDGFSEKIMELDGISGRIERLIKEESKNEL